jgi:photosystem I subunit 3
MLSVLMPIFWRPLLTLADISGLVMCSDSILFKQRLGDRIGKLATRLSGYDESVPAYGNIISEVERVNERFKAYSDGGLLCGKDGLPHLIVSGGWLHAGEFIIPGFIYIYIFGWIGWSGWSYLNRGGNRGQLVERDKFNRIESEYIIHVPTAVYIMVCSALWPVFAFKKIYSKGELLVSDDEVTCSPR